MTYCNHIWGCSAASNLNRIVVLQKKVIRIICRMKPRHSCESKYSELGMMRFLDINVYMISKFMFRVCKGEVPSIFGTYFQANSEVHSHFTRQCNYFHLPVVKSNRAKNKYPLQRSSYMEPYSFMWYRSWHIRSCVCKTREANYCQWCVEYVKFINVIVLRILCQLSFCHISNSYMFWSLSWRVRRGMYIFFSIYMPLQLHH